MKFSLVAFIAMAGSLSLTMSCDLNEKNVPNITEPDLTVAKSDQLSATNAEKPLDENPLESITIGPAEKVKTAHYRHCERSEAIQAKSHLALDCFTSFAMTNSWKK